MFLNEKLSKRKKQKGLAIIREDTEDTGLGTPSHGSLGLRVVFRAGRHRERGQIYLDIQIAKKI